MITRTLISSIIICLIYIVLSLSLKKELNLEFIILIFLMSYLYIKSYSKDKIQTSYEQLEILIPLFNELEIKKRIPHTRGYAASPDYLFEIKNIIKKEKPKLILEAGSGVSTLISAYSLKKYGEGQIISLDHEKLYADKTIIELKKHNLEKYANILYAPLKKYDNDLLWYDADDALQGLGLIDLFIIDGPPKNSSKNARFPALPLMFNKMKIGTIIILDDARRKSEQDTVLLWKQKYDCFDYQYIDNDKGLIIMKKIN